jgi:hypothetical protein
MTAEYRNRARRRPTTMALRVHAAAGRPLRTEGLEGGYVDIEIGQRRPFEKGRPIDIADRQVLDRVDIALPPGGVVRGTVTDETGEPVATRRRCSWRVLEISVAGARLTGNYGDSN